MLHAVMTTRSKNPTKMSRTWGPAEVYAAAGVPRGVAHSWIARQLIPLPPGPGMGKERRFSFLDAMCVAVVAELTKLGFVVGSASYAAGMLVRSGDSGIRSLNEEGWTLVIAPSLAPAGTEAPRMSAMSLVKAESPEDMRKFIEAEYSKFTSLVLVDVSGIARRMRERLGEGTAEPGATAEG